MKMKIEPSDTQKAALDAIRKVAAPFLRLRRTRTAFPSAHEVELYADPPFAMQEEERINDMLAEYLKNQELKIEEFSVGLSMEPGLEGFISITLEQ